MAEDAPKDEPKKDPEEQEAEAAAEEASGSPAAADQNYGNLASLVGMVSFLGGPLLAVVFADEFTLGSAALFTVMLLGGLTVVAFVLPGIVGMGQRVNHVINQVRAAEMVTQPQMRSLQSAAIKQARNKTVATRSSIQDVVWDDPTNTAIAFDGRELVVAKDPTRHTNTWVPLPKMLSAKIRGVRGKLLGTYCCVGSIYLDHNTVPAQLRMPLEDVSDRVMDALEHAFDVAAAPLSHHEVAVILLDAVQRVLGFTTVVNFAVSKGSLEDGKSEDTFQPTLD